MATARSEEHDDQEIDFRVRLAIQHSVDIAESQDEPLPSLYSVLSSQDPVLPGEVGAHAARCRAGGLMQQPGVTPVIVLKRQSGCIILDDQAAVKKNIYPGDDEPGPGCEAQVVASVNERLGKVSDDRHFGRELDNLMVDCNFKPSCDWRGRLLDLNAHLFSACPEIEVGCQYGNCQAFMARKLLAEHHATSCQEFEVDCIAGCGEKVKRGELDSHLNDQSKHLRSMYTEMQQLKDDIRRKDSAIESLEKKVTFIESLKKEMAAMQRQLDEVKNGTTTAVRSNRSAGLNHANTAAPYCTEDLVTPHQCGALLVQHKDTGSLVSSETMTFREMEVRLLPGEVTTMSGSLVWKIPNFSRHLEYARQGIETSLYTPPFYTGPRGNKSCIRLYPNGDGVGFGKYVSLSFVIMKGEFDALLPQPCQQRVTIKLLDQSFISRGYAESYVATSDCTFQRPTASMNVAAGCPRFVAHEFLTFATNWIKNDTLNLKIDIDTTGPDQGRVWG